jgi:uncharacterized protein YoaH (UPF0181 family)
MTLHKQFLQLAKEKQKITYKLLSLLPEIYRTGIYKKYANTIHGYAWQYAQIPESVVTKTLNLEQKLADKLILKAAIAEVGIHKVAIVESLVSNDNEQVIVEKIKNMSSAAIQSMAKELRQSNRDQAITINLNADTQKLFLTAKKLLNITDLTDEKVFQVILEYIVTSKETKLLPEPILAKPVISKSRHIPTKTKRKTKQKYDNRCSYPSCTKNSTILHHVDRYAYSKNHQKVLPLCKIHHEFAHNSLIKNETLDPSTWEFQLIKTTNLIDLKYQKFRS